MNSQTAITITINTMIQYKNGQILLVKGKVKEVQQSDKAKILTMQFPKITVVNTQTTFITQLAAYIRQRPEYLFQHSLSPVSASLLIGIVFGGKEGMPQDFIKSLQTTG